MPVGEPGFGALIAGPAAVVVNKDVAFAGRRAGSCGVVLADDPAELAQFGGLIEIRADLPYDVAGGLFDDSG